MSKQDVIDQFALRAQEYEEYSAWCRSQELHEMCTEPLQDMLPSVECLDVGGGTGRLAYDDFRKTGRHWTVLDACREMGAMVPSGVTFVLGDAEQMPFPAATFAHIVTRSVLHYVDPDKVLGECARVITERGHLVVAQKVLRPPGLEDRSWLREYLFNRNPLFRNHWSIEDQEDAIRRAGFVLLTTRTYLERREMPLEIWITRSGTITPERQRKLLALIQSPPSSIQDLFDFSIQGGVLSYNRLWAVTIARLETVKSGLVPAVVSLIVERSVDGTKQVLLQKRKKRYEEPLSVFGSWELPQGRIELGHSLRAQMERELHQETGLRMLEESKTTELSVSAAGGTVEHFFPLCCTHTFGDLEYLACAMVVRASGEPRSVDIDREHQWVPVWQLRDMLSRDLFYPVCRPMLEVYIDTCDRENAV